MSCVSSATSTQFETLTSNSVSTSFSSSVTTLPGSVTTIASTSCLVQSTPTGTGGGSPTCISSTVINSVSTIAGSVSTVQVPVVTTIPVTVTQATATLFGSSCSDGDTTSPTTQPTTAPTSTPTNSPTNSPTTPPTTPNSPSTSSPPPITGSTTVTQVLQGTTITTIVPLSSVQPNSDSNGSHSSSNLGPILGGIFAGVFGLVLIVGVIWWILRRRSRWDDIFDEKEGYDDAAGGADGIRRSRSRGNMLDTEFASDVNTEPKPYEYGLVGAARPLSPPSENVGVRPVDHPSMHGRNLSDAPLILGAASTGHLLTPSGTSQASHNSRPSTSSSYFLPGQGPSDVGHSPRHTGGFFNAPGSGAAPIVPPLPSPPSAGVVPGTFSAQQPIPTHGGPGSPTRSGTVYEDSLLGSPPQQARTLFVANQLDGERVGSPPVSPKGEAFAKGKRRESAGAASRTSGEMGPGSSSARPLSPQRQSTSPVIVHQDAGRASTDAPANANRERKRGGSGGSGSGGDAPPPAYAE